MKHLFTLAYLIATIGLTAKGWIQPLDAHTPPNQPPILVANPTTTPAVPLLGQEFVLQLAAADPDGDPLTYTWEMGDGLRAYGNPVHWRYNLDVVYSITTTIQDGRGGVLTATTQISITDSSVLNPPIQPPLFPSEWTTGSKSILLILVSYADMPLTSTNPTAILNVANQTNLFWQTTAYGQLSLSNITVTPILTLTTSTSDYPLSPGDAQGFRNSFNKFRVDTRNLARAAGYDPDDYDLDAVVTTDYFGASAANNGNKGLLLTNPNFPTLSHELGHNLGLRHATNWNTNSAGQSIIGPGQYTNYGNAFDVMGVGTDSRYHHTAYSKERLGWLPASHVTAVTNSGTYRLYAMDTPTLVPNHTLLLRLPRDVRDYWLEYRQLFPANAWTSNGVLVGFTPWPGTAGTAPLLDTTPSSPFGQFNSAGDTNDSALTIGRTLVDTQAQWFITPIGRGGTTPDSYLDITINRGPFPSNVAPTATLTAESLIIPLNTTTHFTATATDANGDTLAYHWDFDDDQFGSTNNPTISYQWSQAGDYVVRVTVSDMKGGTVSQLVVVQVGTPTTHKISGTVTGGTAEGVRVTATLGGQTWLTYSDSAGQYTLTGLPDGMYVVRPSWHGYGMTPNNQNVLVSGTDINGINFNATPNNTPPTLQPLPNQTFPEDTISQPITITIGDTQTTAGALVVLAESGNPTLIPHNNIIISGNGANRTLKLVPLFHQFGTSIITVTVSDGLEQATQTFLATVTAVDDAPQAGFDTYTADGPLIIPTTTGLLSNDGDVENNPLTAVLTAAPLHGTLTLNPAGSFIYTPTLPFSGFDYFFYTAHDGTNNSPITPVTIQVGTIFGVSATGTAAQSGLPNTTLTHTITLTNTGNTTDTIQIILGTSLWPTQLSQTSLTLAAGQTGIIQLFVTIPASAADDDMDSVLLTATSQGDTSQTAVVTLISTADIPLVVNSYPIYLPLVARP
ncbi:MAG: PKD domain-containing protein [Chloroflexi bacterium]|nr:PKD domain-containing protein [Chloroflexota bacterium]